VKVLSIFSKEQLREMIKEKQLRSAADVQGMLKEMLAETL